MRGFCQHCSGGALVSSWSLPPGRVQSLKGPFWRLFPLGVSKNTPLLGTNNSNKIITTTTITTSHQQHEQLLSAYVPFVTCQVLSI